MDTTPESFGLWEGMKRWSSIFYYLQEFLYWKLQVGAGGTIEPVKCLLYKHENLSSMLGTHIKRLDMIVGICNPSSGEAETEGSLGFAGQLG